MLNSFGVAFNAVMPFLVYLSIGYIIVRIGVTDRPFLSRLNALNFRVFFPFLMFQNIYGASPESLPSAKLIALTVVSLLSICVLLVLIVPRIVRENPRRGVIIQASYRSNFVLYGVALTVFVFGQEKASVAGFMTLLVVSFFNISSVIVLEMFNGNQRVTVWSLLVKVCKNPLLQGCFVGIIFFALGLRLPVWLASPVSALSSLATPLAMITLGGALEFGALRKNLRYITPVLLMKLVALPLLMLTLGYLLGLRGVELFLLLMIFGAPVAASSYPMAVNMGGDGELAGQLVFVSTALSLLTIFTFIFTLSQLGLLL